MIKCPLCGWNNPESTQLCVSCGGDLERRTGLIREDGNPDCYSFTPPRRILDKGVGATGSGNDLVFRFSNSFYVILLIVSKIILFVSLPYACIKLYIDDNSLFYILIPLMILHMIDVIGWIFFTYGSRKKKRKIMGLGMRFLYAFHVIALAYCILTALITLYLSIAIGVSMDLGAPLAGVIGAVSSIEAIYFTVGVASVLLLLIVFFNICAKFFHCIHDIFTRNSTKYYKFTGVIPIGFFILSFCAFVCSVSMFFKENVLDFISRHRILEEYLYSMVEESSALIAIISGILAIVALISALMVVDYIKNYKRLFVIDKKTNRI